MECLWLDRDVRVFASGRSAMSIGWSNRCRARRGRGALGGGRGPLCGRLRPGGGAGVGRRRPPGARPAAGAAHLSGLRGVAL